MTEALSGIPNARPYQLRIIEARMASDPASYIVHVTGDRFRMDGTPATRKHRSVERTTRWLLEGWTEILGLPALPPREWAREAGGTSVYSEHQRAGIAAQIVDLGAAYRVRVGDADQDRAVPGDQVAHQVAEALAEDGKRLDRHADGRTLRLHRGDGSEVCTYRQVTETRVDVS
ncbi:hypothetical protein ACIF70_39190 [Actinacidiphila glaucinigra]|uniref:hypothetical protein n=1 Tax=Actinacidiphila glaucinigra TaxID=235986 RepID=UPI0037C9540E